MSIVTNLLSLLASSMLRVKVSVKDVEAVLVVRDLASKLPLYLQLAWILGAAILIICFYDHMIAINGLLQATASVLRPIRLLLKKAYTSLCLLLLLVLYGPASVFGAILLWSLYSRRYFISGFLILMALLSSTYIFIAELEANKSWSFI